MVIRTTDYICLLLVINFTCKQIDDINLPEILNQRDVKQALPSNLNYNDSPVLTYKFGQKLLDKLFNCLLTSGYESEKVFNGQWGTKLESFGLPKPDL